MRYFVPRGPAGTKGSHPISERHTSRRGNGALCLAGPMPRVVLATARRYACCKASDHACPSSRWASLTRAIYCGADLYPPALSKEQTAWIFGTVRGRTGVLSAAHAPALNHAL